jgi:hypothetical protein
MRYSYEQEKAISESVQR